MQEVKAVMKFYYHLVSCCVFSIVFLSTPARGGTPDLDSVLNKEKMKPAGQWCTVTVPDTLDLAHRAELGVNVLTSNVDPNRYYGVIGLSIGGNPPAGKTFGEVKKFGAANWNIPSHNVRTLPLLRVMCGSEQNLDVEYDMMRTLMGRIDEGGLAYYPDVGHKQGIREDTAYPVTSGGTMALAAVNWYERDGSQDWLNWVEHIGNGLKKVAIQVEDRAYYPLESGVDAEGQWHYTYRGGGADAPLPYTSPEEPEFEQQGHEGTVKWENGAPLRALVKDYQYNGNQESLEMARKIARFCLKPGMWEDTSEQGYPGNEHGIFAGHFHGNMECIHALLDFAVADNNERLKQIVREAYAHAQHSGVARAGWFPCWSRPEKFGRDKWFHGVFEGCGVSDVVILAVKLSDAGLGDYWDDVDSIVRNQLAAQQIVDLDLMREVSGWGKEYDELLKSYLGGFFAFGRPTCCDPYIPPCCTANGNLGLYYAWHGITRFDKGIATVNLFLNRASSWMDIDSYIPYEGKVVLHNKKAHTAMVHIPRWIDRSEIKCFIGKNAVNPPSAGNYLLFQNIEAGDDIRLEFPLLERVDEYFYHDKTYRVHFRGNTVMDVLPRDNDSQKKYSVYPRRLKSDGSTPMHTVRRFVADKVIPLF